MWFRRPPRVHIVTVKGGQIVAARTWEILTKDTTLLLVSDGRVDVKVRNGMLPQELDEVDLR